MTVAFLVVVQRQPACGRWQCILYRSEAVTMDDCQTTCTVHLCLSCQQGVGLCGSTVHDDGNLATRDHVLFCALLFQQTLLRGSSGSSWLKTALRLDMLA
jgi:hypothetical protein